MPTTSGWARWLQGELEAILNPPFADMSMPIAGGSVLARGRVRRHLPGDRRLGRRPHRAELVGHGGEPLHAEAAAGQRRHRAVGGLQLPHALPDRRRWRSRARGPRATPTKTSCSGARRAPPASPGPRPGCAAEGLVMLPNVAVFAMGRDHRHGRARGTRRQTLSGCRRAGGGGAATRRCRVDREAETFRLLPSPEVTIPDLFALADAIEQGGGGRRPWRGGHPRHRHTMEETAFVLDRILALSMPPWW